jgi:hypothetical protein
VREGGRKEGRRKEKGRKERRKKKKWKDGRPTEERYLSGMVPNDPSLFLIRHDTELPDSPRPNSHCVHISKDYPSRFSLCEREGDMAAGKRVETLFKNSGSFYPERRHSRNTRN